MKINYQRIFLLIALFLCVGCAGAVRHRDAVTAASESALTVGTVQREIRVGMSSADVISALGSPNIVTTDDQRREVWVYDRIATDTVYSADSGGFAALIFGGYSAGSGAGSTSQRTFTVVVKFDSQQKVRDFAYHTSRF